MNNFYDEFPIKSIDDWLELAKIQLKGRTIEEALHINNPIEEIEYFSYGFDSDCQQQKPSSGTFKRGTKSAHNDWINNVCLLKSNAKDMNAYAHRFLMNGATGIKVDISNFSLEEIKVLNEGIGFDHIAATIFYSTKEQFDWIRSISNENTQITAVNLGSDNFGLIAHAKNRLVRAIDVQYTGGNAAQEIAYALYAGHETLFALLKDGLSIDEAAKQIKFLFGIGSNYFIELNKFRVFRSLWYTVVKAYEPKDEAAAKAYIEAETGFLNKSLEDPHTNLLRQTTEAASAVLGAVDEITVQPYNLWSNDSMESKERAQHLGINIALLLKEESYLDKVIDPSGGSYIIENLYNKLKVKAWELFQDLEDKGMDFLNNEIQRIANIRIDRVENQKDMLIGVNKYFNIETENSTWNINRTTAFGEPMILEIKAKIEK